MSSSSSSDSSEGDVDSAALLAAAKKLLKKEKKKKKKETNGGSKKDKNKQKRKEREAAAKASATSMKSRAKATPPTKSRGMLKVAADAPKNFDFRTGARKSATVVRSIFDSAPSSGTRIAGKTSVASAGGSGIFAASGSGGHPSIVGPLTKMAMDPSINRKMSDWRDLTGPGGKARQPSGEKNRTGALLTEYDLTDYDRDRADAPFLFEPGPKKCRDCRTGVTHVLDADAAQAAWLREEVEILQSQPEHEVGDLGLAGRGDGGGAGLAAGGADEHVGLGGAAGIDGAEAADEDVGAGGGDENAAGAADGDIGGAGGNARGASTGDVGAGADGSGGGTEVWADGNAADVSCLVCPMLGAGADSATGEAIDAIDPETTWLLTAYAGQGGPEEAAQVLKVVEEERPASYSRLLSYGQRAGEDLDWLRWAPTYNADGNIDNVGIGCWVCKAHGKPDAGKKTAQSSYIFGNVLLETEAEKSSKGGSTYLVDVPRNGTAVSQVLVHAKTNAHQFAAAAYNRLYRSGLIDAAGASTVKEIKKGPQYGAVDLWRPPRALFDVTETLLHHCWISIYKNETQEGWSLHAEVTLAKMQGGDKGSTSGHSYQEYAAALYHACLDDAAALLEQTAEPLLLMLDEKDSVMGVLIYTHDGNWTHVGSSKPATKTPHDLYACLKRIVKRVGVELHMVGALITDGAPELGAFRDWDDPDKCLPLLEMPAPKSLKDKRAAPKLPAKKAAEGGNGAKKAAVHKKRDRGEGDHAEDGEIWVIGDDELDAQRELVCVDPVPTGKEKTLLELVRLHNQYAYSLYCMAHRFERVLAPQLTSLPRVKTLNFELQSLFGCLQGEQQKKLIEAIGVLLDGKNIEVSKLEVVFMRWYYLDKPLEEVGDNMGTIIVFCRAQQNNQQLPVASREAMRRRYDFFADASNLLFMAMLGDALQLFKLAVKRHQGNVGLEAIEGVTTSLVARLSSLKMALLSEVVHIEKKADAVRKNSKGVIIPFASKIDKKVQLPPVRVLEKERAPNFAKFRDRLSFNGAGQVSLKMVNAFSGETELLELVYNASTFAVAWADFSQFISGLVNMLNTRFRSASWFANVIALTDAMNSKTPMKDAKAPLTNLSVNLTSTHPARKDDMLAVLTEAYEGLVDAFTVPGRRPQEVVDLCIEYDVKNPVVDLIYCCERARATSDDIERKLKGLRGDRCKYASTTVRGHFVRNYWSSKTEKQRANLIAEAAQIYHSKTRRATCKRKRPTGITYVHRMSAVTEYQKKFGAVHKDAIARHVAVNRVAKKSLDDALEAVETNNIKKLLEVLGTEYDAPRKKAMKGAAAAAASSSSSSAVQGSKQNQKKKAEKSGENAQMMADLDLKSGVGGVMVRVQLQSAETAWHTSSTSVLREVFPLVGCSSCSALMAKGAAICGAEGWAHVRESGGK
eukprot:g9265.t1